MTEDHDTSAEIEALRNEIELIKKEMKARSYVAAEDIASNQGEALAARALSMFSLILELEKRDDKLTTIDRIEKMCRELIVRPRSSKIAAERASQISEDRMLQSLSSTIAQIRSFFK